jgi:hypothetical protein
LLFKSGFVPLRLYNESRARVEQLVPTYRTMPTKELQDRIAWLRGSPEDAVQDCIWDGLTLQMAPFRGSSERWLQHLLRIIATVRYEETSATMTLHHRLLEEQARYTREADASVAQRARGFFTSVETRLREASR